MERQRFKSDLQGFIAGRYSFDTASIEVAPERNSPWVDHRATLMHERIHQELTDMSEFGGLQKFFHFLSSSEAVPRHERELFERLTGDSVDSCFLVHEGLACYRESCWYKGFTQNEQLWRMSLLDDYKSALHCVEKIFPELICFTSDVFRSGSRSAAQE